MRNHQRKLECYQELAIYITEEHRNKYLVLADEGSFKKSNEELEVLKRECTSTESADSELVCL